MVMNTHHHHRQYSGLGPLRRVKSECKELNRGLYTQEAIDAGVFASTRCLFPMKNINEETPSSSSSTLSMDTGIVSLASSSCPVSRRASYSINWKSSGSMAHNRDAPLIVSNPDLNEDAIVDPAMQLGRILSYSRHHLPKVGHYSSNHVMVNQERIKRTAAPLIRMHELDEAARMHAESMANEGKLFHMDPDGVLRASLKDRPCRRLGENVAKGKNIRDIHVAMMQTLAQKNNIVDRRFTHMGMATAHGADGDLYLCQIFRG